jgi:hypothetical protein
MFGASLEYSAGGGVTYTVHTGALLWARWASSSLLLGTFTPGRIRVKLRRNLYVSRVGR